MNGYTLRDTQIKYGLKKQAHYEDKYWLKQF